MKIEKPTYRLIAYRSWTLCKVYDVPDLRWQPIIYGPWKRLKFTKKRAAALRRSRVVTFNPLGEQVDNGPAYSRVVIEMIGGGLRDQPRDQGWIQLSLEGDLSNARGGEI